MAGRLIILSAPSGAGKTSLVKALVQDSSLPLRLSISTTTRPPRLGEVHGREYFFTDVPTFEQRIAKGEFLEWARVHDNLYGTAAADVQAALDRQDQLLLEIDWQGAAQIRARFAPEQLMSIFILPPSLAELRRRLESRGQDSQAVIDRRVAAAEAEMAHANEFDHVIMNQDFSVALAELKRLICHHDSPTQPE
jgi:guanylate kinase